MAIFFIRVLSFNIQDKNVHEDDFPDILFLNCLVCNTITNGPQRHCSIIFFRSIVSLNTFLSSIYTLFHEIDFDHRCTSPT